jgi:hypothetical protein
MMTETFTSVDRVAAPSLPGISLAGGRVAGRRQLHVNPQTTGAMTAAAVAAVVVEPVQWQHAIAPAADATLATMAMAGFAAATKRYAVTTNHAVRGDKGSKPWRYPS